MKTLLLILLLATSGFTQTLDPLVATLRTGETVTLNIFISEPADSISIYRKTSAGTLNHMAMITVVPNVWAYKWTYTMPGGTVDEYTFYAVVLKRTNEIKVTRKK